MADIGVLPSLTSVQITSSNGENGTIPSATPKGAGVMSAEHARQLDTLWGIHKTGVVTGATELAPIVIETPQARPVDAVTRGELRQAMSELQRIVSSNTLPALTNDQSLTDRLAALESREMDQERRIQALTQALDTALAMLADVASDQEFVEQNALAAVSVKEIAA